MSPAKQDCTKRMQSVASRRRLWPCRHGRLDRWPSQILPSAPYRLQSARIPRSRPRHGAYPWSCYVVGHPSDRLSCLGYGSFPESTAVKQPFWNRPALLVPCPISYGSRTAGLSETWHPRMRA